MIVRVVNFVNALEEKRNAQKSGKRTYNMKHTRHGVVKPEPKTTRFQRQLDREMREKYLFRARSLLTSSSRNLVVFGASTCGKKNQVDDDPGDALRNR